MPAGCQRRWSMARPRTFEHTPGPGRQEMPEGEGTPKKKPRKKRRVEEPASRATGAARSARRPKDRGKARKASGPQEPEPGPENGAADWADIYDRAARKLQDFADQARPAANRAQEAA